MDGFVIVLEHDDNQSISYWADSSPTESLEKATFFTDAVTARQASGKLQAQYTDRTVRIAAASKGVQLKTGL